MSTHKLFGTDGIRGTPGEHPLTDHMLTKISHAIAVFLREKHTGESVFSSVVIGKDTRTSGSQIENILAEAFTSQGVDVYLAGIITTPGLSFLTREFKADMGIMISASHNKATDNGVKFFNFKGCKLSTDEEDAIEQLINGLVMESERKPAKKRALARIHHPKDSREKYTKFLLSTVKGMNLKGVCVALDCASGSASLFAKEIFSDLKADIHSIHDLPHGEKINIGGALQPQFLKELVLKTKADIGVALDGDGDRGILVDDTGNILDGDYILAIMANYLKGKKKLPQNTIVTTVMCNFGLTSYLKDIGVKSIAANVGDKYVLAELLKNGLSLGGEQSGHIVFFDYLPTPDGLLTALQVLKVMQETGVKLSQLSQCITKCPQILVNIKVKEKRPFEEMPALCKQLESSNRELHGKGRILLRYSGTETLARVMVEGISKQAIEEIAHSLAREIKKEIGAD